MSIDQALQEIDRLEVLLLQRLSDVVHVAALDMVQKISDRVIETGKNAEGQNFKPYSERPFLAFYFFGKSANQTGEARVRQAAKQGKTISYKDFRRLNGRPVDHKNFSFTGQMWKSFGVIRVSGTAGIARLEIGMRDAQADKKLQDNSKRERINIIAPSAQELAQFKADIIAGLFAV